KPVRGDAKRDGLCDLFCSMTDRMAGHDTKEGFIRENVLGGCPGMPFFPNSALCSKNYPRNIN
ncbi:MAG: hypothetical protein B1H11_07825, partial [Desulfobacteraceae bacterium 4484_190.1]